MPIKRYHGHIFIYKNTSLINALNVFIKIIGKKMKKSLRISKYLIE